MRFNLIFTSCLTAILCACHADGDPLGPVAAPSLSGASVGAIAGDLSARLAEQAGSAPRSLKLHDDGTTFATALEAALKGWGYTVAKDDSAAAEKSDPLELRYSLADLDGQVFARLSTDTITLSRIYSVTVTGATPASPLSVAKRN